MKNTSTSCYLQPLRYSYHTSFTNIELTTITNTTNIRRPDTVSDTGHWSTIFRNTNASLLDMSSCIISAVINHHHRQHPTSWCVSNITSVITITLPPLPKHTTWYFQHHQPVTSYNVTNITIIACNITECNKCHNHVTQQLLVTRRRRGIFYGQLLQLSFHLTQLNKQLAWPQCNKILKQSDIFLFT